MTVKITKPALNLREELADLRKPSGIAGEAVLRADTTADAREAVELSNVADDATGVDVSGTVTADGLTVNTGSYGAVGAGSGRMYGSSSHGLVIQGNGTTNDFLFLGSDGSESFNIANNRDISFYDDTGSSAKFHWDASAESLGIGTSTPSTRLTVGDGVSSETIKVNAGSGWADIRLDSSASNGGSIYWNDGADSGQIFYYHVDNSMRFHTAATERMRIDSSGHAIIPAGVTLGTTVGTYAAANTLDDYEEGTWTVAVTGSTSAGSYSNAAQGGYYTKVGALVTVYGWYYGTSGTGTGDLVISGLPFQIEGSISAVGTLQANGNITYPAGTTQAILYGAAGTSSMTVRCNHASGGTWTNMAYPTAANYLRFSLSYRTTQ